MYFHVSCTKYIQRLHLRHKGVIDYILHEAYNTNTDEYIKI
jgi:hypothetical protein